MENKIQHLLHTDILLISDLNININIVLEYFRLNKLYQLY